MLLGLINSQAAFAKVMDKILLKVDNVRCYVDDVVIFSKITDEHARHLTNVLRFLKGQGLRLRIKKCSFMQPSVELLGHIVNKNGLQVDDQTAEKVRDAIPPTTRKEFK